MWPKLLLAYLLLLAAPALAQTQPFGERTQETVPVGNGRFLIFVGAPDEKRTGYTVDLIQVSDGIPFYVPLFIEDFDAETGGVHLSYGVAFFAKSYTYDRATNHLTIKADSVTDSATHYEMRYRLDGDIFHLQQATAISGNSAVPKLLFKATPKPAS